MPGFPIVRSRRAPITALALALALLPAGAAHAASAPVITKVTPMKVEIGQTLTIKGRGFRAGAFKNTVAFKRSRKPAVFVKVPTATTTQLTVPVPEKLLPFLQDAKGKAIVRQFRLRVLAKRFGKAFTSAKLSPRIGPPGSNGGPGAPDRDADLQGRADVGDDRHRQGRHVRRARDPREDRPVPARQRRRRRLGRLRVRVGAGPQLPRAALPGQAPVAESRSTPATPASTSTRTACRCPPSTPSGCSPPAGASRSTTPTATRTRTSTATTRP